jgi:hypothetical protein
MARNSPSLKSLIKTGFGISIGFFLSRMIFIAIGLAFFIPGYIMFLKASKDKKESSSSQIGGVILMGLGVIIMGGMGFGFLMDSIGDMSLD